VNVPPVVLAGRRVNNQHMLDRAFILDRAVVRTAGGTTSTWTPRAGGALRCRFGPVTDTEATIAAGIGGEKATSVVSFPVGTVVAENAKVRNVATGRDWLVVANLTAESAFQVQVRLLIREA